MSSTRPGELRGKFSYEWWKFCYYSRRLSLAPAISDSSNSIPPPRTTGGGWRWDPPTPAELQAIRPQYEVQMLVGRGVMGSVYKGMQLSLERSVAIKLLPPAIELQDTAFAERFKNEAKLMGRMNHPAIVSVYDFGRTSDGEGSRPVRSSVRRRMKAASSSADGRVTFCSWK